LQLIIIIIIIITIIIIIIIIIIITGFGKVENNKHPSAEEKEHTVKDKLKEDL